MSDQHLKLHSSGHLTLHSSGHLTLYSVDTFSLSLNSNPTYGAALNRSFNWPDSNAPQSEIDAGCAAAKAALASGGSYARVVASAWAEVQSWSGTVATVKFGSSSAGWIYKFSSNSGGSFPSGGVLCPSITFTRATNSYPYASYVHPGGVLLVGTGSSAPTGLPHTWSSNLFSGGTQTLTNVTLSEYVWVGLDLPAWTFPSSQSIFARAGGFTSVATSGTIYPA